jgi:hypothetical protein
MLIQVAAGQFYGLAGANQQGRALAQVGEDALGEIDRDRRNRQRVGADLGLGADALGSGEGMREQARQQMADRLLLLRNLERLLDLTQDLRLAQHHGI